MHIVRWVLTLGILSTAGFAQETGTDACREHVLPTPEELSWRSVPWRPSFGLAALEADREDKPVLLWAMNGHPLGCT